jgi:DNA helicase-4
LIRRKFPALSITYNTAHSLKGREADYILLINLNSGRYGFPCQIQDDPVLNLVLAKPDAYPNAEERRLFYVAVTHAKKHVYLLAHLEHPSSFATEITRDQYDVKLLNNPADLLLVCPQCKTGRIVKKDGNWGTFFSCNNYPYCDYKPTSCPSCHNGVLFLDQQYYRCINNECKFHALICPRCHNGYLRRRTGRRGAFLGCSNYPQCYYTQNI